MTAAPRGVARATARERLLVHCALRRPPKWATLMCRKYDAKTRRLLAAVLREYGACMGHLDNLKFAAAMKVAGVDEATSRRVFAAIDSTVLRAGRSRMGGAR